MAAVLKPLRGAVDVFADQVVGENYLEISIDRKKAARYGVKVEDVQNVIEVALGGKEITSTVEGRRRFPVRVRYPRDFREDEEQVRNLLVDAGEATIHGLPAGHDHVRKKLDVVEASLALEHDVALNPLDHSTELFD